jgi:hypothetical protein
MRVRSPQTPRRNLCIEMLEDRLALSGGSVIPASPTNGLIIRLDPNLDITGQEVVTVEAYQSALRATFALFDTGSSAISFSAADQAAFLAASAGIPISIKGGGVVEGLGGVQVGDVSLAGTIQADGLHAATLSFNDAGKGIFTFSLSAQSAIAPGIQAFVGTQSGSPTVQSILGTPILGGSPSSPAGYAAVIEMQGVTLDLSAIAPGLIVTLPDVRFSVPGTSLFPASGTTDPVRIPLSLIGSDNHTNPGNDITGSPIPVQTGVGVSAGNVTVSHQKFLFDTGAQISVISPTLASTLGLDLSHPTFTQTVTGVAGTTTLKGYVLASLTLPQSDGGTLTLSNVPVFVMDPGNGLSGILGMNLFNMATALVYDPYSQSGASFSVSFSLNPDRSAPDPRLQPALSSLGLWFGNGLNGPTQPITSPTSLGSIAGKVYFDANWNRQLDPREQGIGNASVYIDKNNNGKFDAGDLNAISDSSGSYQFKDLEPGQYVVRELLPNGIFLTSPAEGFATVVVTANNVTTLNFGNQNQVVTQLTGYLVQSYGTILDRPPDAGGLAYWSNQMAHGLTRPAVVLALWQSTEHRIQQVQDAYLQYLGRNPGAGEQAYWVNQLLTGLSEDQFNEAIVQSPEYLELQGGDQAFLSSLYTNLLGRDLDVASEVSWINALASGLSRAQLVNQVLGSAEFSQNEVDRIYQTVLHRPADAPGQYHWQQSLLQHQTTSEALAITFLASDEYYALAAQFISAEIDVPI